MLAFFKRVIDFWFPYYLEYAFPPLGLLGFLWNLPRLVKLLMIRCICYKLVKNIPEVAMLLMVCHIC